MNNLIGWVVLGSLILSGIFGFIVSFFVGKNGGKSKEEKPALNSSKFEEEEDEFLNFIRKRKERGKE